MPACRCCCSTSCRRAPRDRSALARGAIARMLGAEPAPFMTPDAAKLVTPGNLEDDLAALADVDWIVEAIVEEPSVKQALYARLEPVRRPGSIVSSNTSTIPLAYLTEGSAGELPARLPDHPFLQSAALHAAAGGGRRPDDPSRRRSRRSPASPISASARAWCAAKDTPGLHRQPDRHLLAADGDRPRRSSWA